MLLITFAGMKFKASVREIARQRHKKKNPKNLTASLYTLEYQLRVKITSFDKLQGVFASRFYLLNVNDRKMPFPSNHVSNSRPAGQICTYKLHHNENMLISTKVQKVIFITVYQYPV